MSVGYSGKPLWQKLGIKEGQTLCVFNPQPGYEGWLGELPPGARTSLEWPEGFETGLAFMLTRADLDAVVSGLVPKVAPTGCLWVSWPKKSSSVPTELDFDTVQKTLLETRLVDTKVCAVSEDFTGLKFMVRKSMR